MNANSSRVTKIKSGLPLHTHTYIHTSGTNIFPHQRIVLISVCMEYAAVSFVVVVVFAVITLCDCLLSNIWLVGKENKPTEPHIHRRKYFGGGWRKGLNLWINGNLCWDLWKLHWKWHRAFGHKRVYKNLDFSIIFKVFSWHTGIVHRNIKQNVLPGKLVLSLVCVHFRNEIR